MTNLTKRLGGGGNIIENQIDNWTVNHKFCGVDGCNEKTNHAIALVLRKGKPLSGRFSDFGRWKVINGETTDLKLFPEYDWVGWVTRCTEHLAFDKVKFKQMMKQHGAQHEDM